MYVEWCKSIGFTFLIFGIWCCCTSSYWLFKYRWQDDELPKALHQRADNDRRSDESKWNSNDCCKWHKCFNCPYGILTNFRLRENESLCFTFYSLPFFSLNIDRNFIARLYFDFTSKCLWRTKTVDLCKMYNNLDRWQFTMSYNYGAEIE